MRRAVQRHKSKQWTQPVQWTSTQQMCCVSSLTTRLDRDREVKMAWSDLSLSSLENTDESREGGREENMSSVPGSGESIADMSKLYTLCGSRHTTEHNGFHKGQTASLHKAVFSSDLLHQWFPNSVCLRFCDNHTSKQTNMLTIWIRYLGLNKWRK